MNGNADSVKARLINVARERGQLVDEVFLRYCLHRFLFRLMISESTEKYVLKGGVLFNHLYVANQRMTRDLDLSSLNPYDASRVLSDLKMAMELELPDGITWVVSSLNITYRERGESGPLSEISFTCFLGRSEIVVKLDISYSDVMAVEPEKITLSGPLDDDQIEVSSYPIESIIAEKLHAIFSLGERSTRLKDYFDLFFLLQDKFLREGILMLSIEATFNNRKTQIPTDYEMTQIPNFILSKDFEARWGSFLKKIGHSYIDPKLIHETFKNQLPRALAIFGSPSFLSHKKLPPIVGAFGLFTGLPPVGDWQEYRRKMWEGDESSD